MSRNDLLNVWYETTLIGQIWRDISGVINFRYERQQISLAPFYDLVCTRAIERVDARLALALGEEFDPGKIAIKHWMDLARQCHVRESYLLGMLQHLAETLLQNVAVVREQFEAEYGAYPALQRVQLLITKQCKRLLTQLTHKPL